MKSCGIVGNYYENDHGKWKNWRGCNDVTLSTSLGWKRGVPDEWKTSVVVHIFKGKGYVMTCGSYRGVKLLKQWHEDC